MNLCFAGQKTGRRGRESEGVNTVRAAVGWAGWFNLEEQRTFLFRPFGPSLRKEQLRSLLRSPSAGRGDDRRNSFVLFLKCFVVFGSETTDKFDCLWRMAQFTQATRHRVDHPPAPPPLGRRLLSPCACKSLPSGCAASTQPGAFVPCVCLCLSPIASHQVERGMLSCRYLYRPGGPSPTPTHALGSWPSNDRFAVSASRTAIRVPPIFRTCCISIPLSTF